MKVRNGKLQTVDGTVPVEGKLKLCCVWICKLLVDWPASGTSEGKGDLDFILSQGQGVELANATADCICIFVFVYLDKIYTIIQNRCIRQGRMLPTLLHICEMKLIQVQQCHTRMSFLVS